VFNIAFLIFSVSTVSHSEEIDKKFGLGFDVSFASSIDGTYSSCIMYQFNVTYIFAKNFGIEANLGYLNSSEEDDFLSEGNLTIIPVQISLQFRAPLKGSIVPIIGAGYGYYLNSFKIYSEITEPLSNLGFNVEEKVDNVFAFHFQAGIEYFLKESIALNVDYKRFFGNAEATASITDRISGISRSIIGEIKLDTHSIGFGIKYYL